MKPKAKKKPVRKAAVHPLTKQVNMVFTYNDASGQVRRIDGFRAAVKMEAKAKEPMFQQALALLDATDPSQYLVIVDAAREVFSLKPFEEGGMTDLEVFKLWGQFGVWVQEKKRFFE